MKKPLISFALCSVGAAAAISVACGSPDPGVNYAATAPFAASQDAGTVSTGTGSSSGGMSGSSSGTVVTSQDSGTAPAMDASTASDAGSNTDSGGALTGFLGEATPWDAGLPSTTAFSQHNLNSQPQQTPTMDCLTCHGANGPGAPFLAAGYVTKGADAGASDVEVRVYVGSGANMGGYSAHTDTNGYFWINPPLGGTAGPYQAGVRNGTTTTLMPVTQTMTDCQSSTCHGGPPQGNIHIP